MPMKELQKIRFTGRSSGSCGEQEAGAKTADVCPRNRL
jgi:hypothetical protein